MGPFGVVVVDPPVELGLCGLCRDERPAIQELLAQALVESFDLAGGGRGADHRVAVADPVLSADPVEQHSTG
jgi:hypothetical protein